MRLCCAYAESLLGAALERITAYCSCGAELPHVLPVSSARRIIQCANCSRLVWALQWRVQEMSRDQYFNLSDIVSHNMGHPERITEQ